MEKDNNIFYNGNMDERTDLSTLLNIDILNSKIAKSFENTEITGISFYEDGTYKNRQKNFLMRLLAGKRITGLPEFAQLEVEHRTGKHTENLIIWLPYEWNGRFMGTGGGGTSCGGRQYISAADNTERGMTLPKAIMNHFACASTNQGTDENEWAFDQNGNLDKELIDNWNHASTHFMSVFGRFICSVVYGKDVSYAYFHGGSGGGRQAMVEAQRYPNDYDGIWASCPAINWNRFLPMGTWSIAVCNTYHHHISYRKMEYFVRRARSIIGDDNAYYHSGHRIDFDPYTCLNDKVGNESISELDCKVYQEIYKGPCDPNGNPLFMFHRHGNRIFNRIIPIGTFYYPLFSKRMKPFFLSVFYMRWLSGNRKETFDNIDMERFMSLYSVSVEKFDYIRAYDADLDEFASLNHKLIIDHGCDDPLIPVDNTINYVNSVSHRLSKEKTDDFLACYINPGDGHGNCKWHAPSISESTGMKALMDWVEKGIAPQQLDTVLVNRKGETIETSKVKRYELLY